MIKAWQLFVLVAFVICFFGLLFFFLMLVPLGPLPVLGEVVVIELKGPILMGDCPTFLFSKVECVSVLRVKEVLKQCKANPFVRAVVFEVDSSGGSVTASRELMTLIKEFEKPKVAWISGAGLSGAYYAISAADKIVANPHSLVGGMGVGIVIHHYYNLYQKLGINVTVIKSSGMKDLGSPYRPMTEEEKEYLQRKVDMVHRSIVEELAENRKLSFAEAMNLSDGRFFLGLEAKELRLIDELGSLEDAIKLASQLANVTKPSVRRASKACWGWAA